MDYAQFVAWARSCGYTIEEVTATGTTDVVVGTKGNRRIEWERGLDAVWRIRKDRRIRNLPSSR